MRITAGAAECLAGEVTERGDTMFDFVQITEDEADQIITRIRATVEPAE